MMRFTRALYALIAVLAPFTGVSQTSIEVITGHKEDGASVQFVPGKDLLITSSIDKIIIWDVPTSAPVKEFTHAQPYPAVSRDGRLLAFATQANTIEVWDLASLTQLKSIPATFVFNLAFATHGPQLYALTCDASFDVCTSVVAYDVGSGATVFAYNTRINAADMLPTDDGLLIAGENGIVRLDRAGQVVQDIQIKGMNAIRLAELREKDRIAVYSDPEFIPSLDNKGTVITVNMLSGKAVAETKIQYLDFYRDIFLIDKDIEATRKFIEQKSRADDLERWYSQPFGPGPQRGALALNTGKRIGVEFYIHALDVFSLPDCTPMWRMGTNMTGNTVKTHGKYLMVSNQNASYGTQSSIVMWDLLKLSPIWRTTGESADIDTTRQLVYFKNKSSTGKENIRATPMEQWLPADVTNSAYDFFTLACGPEDLIAGNGIIFDAQTRKTTRFASTKHWLTSAWCSPSRLVTCEHNLDDFTVAIQDWQTGTSRTLYRNTKREGYLSDLSVSPDGSIVAWVESSAELRIFDIASGKKVNSILAADRESGITYSFIDNRRMVVAKDNAMSIMDFRSGEVEQSTAFPEFVEDIAYNPLLKKVFVITGSGSVMMLNAADLAHDLTLSTTETKEYWVYTPDGYYKGSRNCERAVVIGNADGVRLSGPATREKHYRPDKVIERANLAPPGYRKIFSLVYGHKDTIAAAPPLTLRTNIGELPLFSQDGNLSLKIICEGPGAKTLHISSNDIPLFGQKGIAIRDSATVSVRLFPKENNVTCLCTSEAGASGAQSFRIFSAEPLRKGSIYYVGLAASSYPDAAKNLKYPLKDVRDMARTLGMLAAFGAQGFHCDTLFNERLTPDNLHAIQKKLRGAETNDLVVVHYTGHGMLNDSSDLFLSTPRTDFSDVSHGSIPYEHVAALLDSVQSMKRLILIDACNSGENPSTIVHTSPGSDAQAKGAFVSVADRQNYFNEFVTEYYSNNVANTGSYILAATSKGNPAYESDIWGNGIFTYALMRGIKNRMTDVNRDGGISVSELQEFVNQLVTRETRLAQKPSSKSENLTNDFFIRQF